MKLMFVAFTTTRGGAAKAAVRIKNLFDCLNSDISFVSIEGGDMALPLYYKITHFFSWVVSQLITKLQGQNSVVKYSLNIFGSQYIKCEIKKAKLLHVHWINNETLNIKDFCLLSNKSVITLHDEWFYCGAEHHALDSDSYERVIMGYNKKNNTVKGFDLNRLVWQRKKKHYALLNGVIFTVPSTWMKSRAEKSYLLRDKDIRVVPNPINTNVFIPNRTEFILDGINTDDFVITFGAIDGGANRIKGFDLLIKAIQNFAEKSMSLEKVKIVIFGGKEKKRSSMFGIKTIELGHISSESELAKVYSRSSITIVPSRAESFGQVAAESLSCGTPVVAFNYSGLIDIIKHEKNGYLAEPFEPESLADGILWYYELSDNEKIKVSTSAREHVINFFSDDVVREKFMSIYKELDTRKIKIIK
ncbi:glycosyltransferase [Aliivibrio fischeri]|uniref:glycosyltransferase n=1 Tax=Aliivibrio fischeri TaxID=668 RepID=UPI0018C65F42|nr:glycosyltransferase [Aliivibrio fischeri]